MSLWRPQRTAGPAVASSVVFGDVIQVSQVKGDVTVSTERPPYRVISAATTPVPLAREQAQIQPSRLLLARHQIVPFTGQKNALDDLTVWISGDEAMAIRMIHAAGGQGKTRLALEAAAKCSQAGWAVWQVTHASGPVSGCQVDLPSGAVLAIVDYADRWPSSQLLTLLNQLHALSHQTATLVRVLLLARSAGYWWPALAGRIDGDLAVPTDEVALRPVAADGDRRGLFIAAASQFAATLGVNHSDWQPPDLEDPGFNQILAVHMAALAAVDAHRHGAESPAQPHAISAYLLSREYAHWQHLHCRLEDPLRTPPRMLHRATFVATLAGPLSRTLAQQALVRTALAAEIVSADQIIDDHRFCHPPEDPGTVFEPLHPDRLGEDLIALSVPGHGYVDAATLPDDWTLTAATPLLIKPGQDPPAWAPAAVTVLVETARRWPHVAVGVLYPLLRNRPELAITAGGATLIRLASIPGIDPHVLQTLESLLPLGRNADLDTAAAAIATALMPHRLAVTTDSAERASLHAVHSWRLANAGRHMDALRAAQAATEIYRRLAEDNMTQHFPIFAESLKDLAISFAEAGKHGEALETAMEAVTLYRMRGGVCFGEHRSGLASALVTLANRLREDGKLLDAIAPARESVEILRDLAGVDPEKYMPQLALALNNVANIYAEVGDLRSSLPAAEEAVAIGRTTYYADPAEYAPDLAMYLNNLANRLGELGRRKDALPLAAQSVAIRRPLAAANPAHIPGLAREVLNLANHLGDLGATAEALPLAREAVELFRSLMRDGSAAYLPEFAMALNNLAVRLEEFGNIGDAVALSYESLAQCRVLGFMDPGRYIGHIGMILTNLLRQLLAKGCAKEADVAFEDTLTAFPKAIHRAYLYMLRCKDVVGRPIAMRIADGATALLLSSGASDTWVVTEARKALKNLRSSDPSGFDQEWISRCGPIPDWLLNEQ